MKPCRGCGGSKVGAPQGHSYCPTCVAAREAAKARCSRCGDPKPAGRGRRLCDSCEPVRVVGRYQPCRKCGARDPKPRGQQYCNDCAQLAREIRPAKQRAKKVRRRKPCKACGKPKGDRRRFYCDACAATRGKTTLCNRCGAQPIRAAGKKHCETCHAQARVKRNAYVAKWRRDRWAEDPEKYRAYHRAQKRKRTPQQRRRDNETKRISYRLKVLDSGRTINEVIAALKTKPVREIGPKMVPARPLHDAVEALIARRGGSDAREAICAQADIAPRTLLAWGPDGDRTLVQWSVADRVLVGLDLCWWEVWTADDPYSYEKARQVFESPNEVAA